MLIKVKFFSENSLVGVHVLQPLGVLRSSCSLLISAVCIPALPKPSLKGLFSSLISYKHPNYSQKTKTCFGCAMILTTWSDNLPYMSHLLRSQVSQHIPPTSRALPGRLWAQRGGTARAHPGQGLQGKGQGWRGTGMAGALQGPAQLPAPQNRPRSRLRPSTRPLDRPSPREIPPRTRAVSVYRCVIKK